MGAVASEGVAGLSLPEGWLPENPTFSLFARRNVETDMWEVVIPGFSIAGQGDDLDNAVENAVDLLIDYLALSANDGISYWDSRRPLPLTARLPIYADVARYVLARSRSKRRRSTDRSYLRLPLHRERIAH